MTYNVTKTDGKQVITCSLTEKQVHDYNANVLDQMNNAKGVSAFCKVCEWAGVPLKIGLNTMKPAKLQDFIKFFDIDPALGINVFEETIVVIN